MRLSSARQILVGDPLPNDCVHETVKLLQRVTLHLAVIQAEGELIHVTGHMLRARTMVDAIHPALQDGVEAPRVVWAHRGALDLPPALASTSLAEPVKDEPRRFLGNANLFRQLQRRDTFPGRDKQVHGIKPLVQGGISSQELNDAIIVRDGLERVMSLWQQLDEESARNALTELEQLGEPRLEGAITTDICGKKDSHAVRLDKEAADSIKKARLHRKVATSIFFESNGGQTRIEATVPEIRGPILGAVRRGSLLCALALTRRCDRKYRYACTSPAAM